MTNRFASRTTGPGLDAILAALCASSTFPPGDSPFRFGPAEVRRIFTVRHDPALITLNATMLDVLVRVSGEVSGPDDEALAGVRASVSSIPDSRPQPPGVFAGVLTVQVDGEDGEERADAAIEKVLENLEAQLMERLYKRPLARIESSLGPLHERLRRIDEQRAKAEELAMTEARAETMRIEAAERQAAAVAAERVAQELERQLTAAMDETRVVDREREALQRRLATLRGQEFMLRERLVAAQAKGDAGAQAQAEAERAAVAAQVADLQAEIASVLNNSKQHQMRIEQMALRLDAERMQKQRHGERAVAEQAELELQRQRLESLRTQLEGERVKGERVIRREVEARQQRLVEERASLRPVVVEPWQ